MHVKNFKAQNEIKFMRCSEFGFKCFTVSYMISKGASQSKERFGVLNCLLLHVYCGAVKAFAIMTIFSHVCFCYFFIK